MMRALGRSRQAKGRGFYDADVNLPAFLTAKNLKPFIPNELYVTSSPRIVPQACENVQIHPQKVRHRVPLAACFCQFVD